MAAMTTCVRLIVHCLAISASLSMTAMLGSAAAATIPSALRALQPGSSVAPLAHGGQAPRSVHRRRRKSPTTKLVMPAVDQPSAAHHLTILKIGDSLGEELGFGLQDLLGANHNVTIVQDAVGDTGLARPDYYNWPVHLAQELSKTRPRVVVIMLGGDDGQGFDYLGRTVTFGTPAWRSIYTQRVAQLMGEATAAGAHVIWVGLPIMGSKYFSSEMASMNAIYAVQASIHPFVTFVPTWSLFANAAGAFSASLPGPGGRVELMRNPDGVHFSGAGDDRLASAVVNAMDKTFRIHL